MTGKSIASLYGRSEERCSDGLTDRRAPVVQSFSTRNLPLRDLCLPRDRCPVFGALWSIVGDRTLLVP